MFIGHYALALAAKRAVPRTSLGALFAASQLPDLVWPVCLLAGWEEVAIEPGITAFNPLVFTSYPWSHSLLMVAAWGATTALGWWLFTRDRAGALAMGLLVVSHWVLDWIAHRPDLLLWPGDSVTHGLGLWQSIPGTMLVEGALYGGGAYLYLQGTQPLDGAGRYGTAALLLLLGAVYLADRMGTPPPNPTFLGWFALVAGGLPVGWAAWTDRHRRPIHPVCSVPLTAA